jgi:hypothetical protein
MKRSVLAVFLSCTLYGQQATLTNIRITDLVQSGVSEAEVLRIIATASQIDFDLRPVSTEAMTKAGVSDTVIKSNGSARERGTGPDCRSCSGREHADRFSEGD